MDAPTDNLRTRAVAEALGLSVSTVKRWVDAGVLGASRTVGKHRMIPRSEAIRIAREMGIDECVLDRRLQSRTASGGKSVSFDQTVCDRLYALLCEEHDGAEQVGQLLRSVRDAGCGAASLGDDLIRPVMERIGHGWEAGSLDIYQEHRASHLIASALTALIADCRTEGSGPNPLALVAAPEDDPYVLSVLLAELVLRESGWDVCNLGVNLPLHSLRHAVASKRPRLICLSLSDVRDIGSFVSDFNVLQDAAAAVDATVMVGGRALDTELLAGLRCKASGHRMRELAEFAGRLRLGTQSRHGSGSMSHEQEANPTRSRAQQVDARDRLAESEVSRE